MNISAPNLNFSEEESQIINSAITPFIGEIMSVKTVQSIAYSIKNRLPDCYVQVIEVEDTYITYGKTETTILSI